MEIKHIVVTGGPCGGKTTALAMLSERLQEAGYTPLIVPEAATLLNTMGITPTIGMMPFQERVLDTMDSLRRVAMESAAKLGKVVMLHDRGIMDGAAYVDSDAFWDLLRRRYGNRIMRDELYDAVFHLTTAAIGAEHAYTTENNPARRERGLEEAAALDGRTMHAWVGHPHWRAIDNSTDFEQKKARLWRELCATLGIPVPVEIERKFLVKPFHWQHLGVPYQVIDIEQMYLMNADPEEERRIRKRGQDGAFACYLTTKRTIRKGERAEVERQITSREYETYAQFRLANTRVIAKKRVCFIYKNQYFEYDVFDNPPNLCLLEIELTDMQQEVNLPPHIEVVEEVTGNRAYSNAMLATTVHKAA